MTTTTPDGPTVLPRGLLILLGLGAATIAVAGMRTLSGIIGPAFLAIVLTIGVHPARVWVRRRGWPEWLGTIIAMVLVYAVLLALCLSLVVSGARLADLLPAYEDDVRDLVGDVQGWFEGLGVGEAEAEELMSGFDLRKLTDLVTELLSALLGLLSDFFFLVTLLFFLALDGAWFPAHLEKVTGSRPTVGAALTSFAQRTRTWIVVTTVFGVIVAVVDTVALWALGVPAAAVWGLLAFITNYIPNIGFVIGLVPPALLALLEGGPGLMATVIVVYCVVNFVIQTIIQPKIVGDAVGLSTSVTFLSLVFWAWVLGALGALLAVPLTLLAKALLVDVDKDAAWVQPLITGPSPVRRRSGRGVAGEQPTPGEPDVPEPDDASEAQVRRDLEARPESAP